MGNPSQQTSYIFIGFNNPHLHKRGVENIILLQSKAMQGERLFYIFFGPQTKVSKWGDITVISVRKFNFLLLNLVLRSLKKKYNSQLFIHSHNYQLSFFCWYKTNVFTVHDGITYLYRNLKRRFVFLFSLIEIGVYKRAKKIHFISNYSKSKSLFSKKHNYKSIIIYNSTPLEKIDKTPDITHINDELSNNSLNIFCVRSVELRARIDLLIEVCMKLKDNSKVNITIAGKGPLLEYYRNIIDDKGIDNLQMLGFINDDDIIKQYKTSDLIIMPSEYGEGFGLPVIEGYLFGKPVIASNRCAIPEIINDEQMLFENNVESIVDKINFFINHKHILSDPAKYISYYQERFSNEKIISIYKQKLYSSIL